MDTMTPTERTAWQKSGELPDRVQIAPKADAPAKATAPPAVGDVKTAEAAPVKAEAERAVSKRQQEANERTQRAVEAATAQLRDELAALKAQQTPPAPRREESRTAPTAPAPSDDPEPQEADFASDPNPYAYLDARADWRARQVFRAQQQKVSEQAAHARHVQQLTKTIETATGRIASYEQAHPEFKTKVDPRLLEIVPESLLPPGSQVSPANELAQETLSSEHVGPLLEFFSTPDGQAEWGRLVSLRGSERLRHFGRLEARFDTAAPSAPAAKHVSSAPTPPAVLGDRPMESVDAVEAAIKRNDPEAYFREQNKRELAALRR